MKAPSYSTLEGYFCQKKAEGGKVYIHNQLCERLKLCLISAVFICKASYFESYFPKFGTSRVTSQHSGSCGYTLNHKKTLQLHTYTSISLLRFMGNRNIGGS